MRRLLSATIVIACLASLTQAWAGTDTEIVFADDLEKHARDQLRRILSRYDVDPWIFTHEVKIEAGVEPHSMPMLTLNTDYLDDDEMQLSVFLHEQAHWFVHDAEGRDAAVAELRGMYPDPARSDFRTYQHLLVAWVELDAMVELVGEERARKKLAEKVRRLTPEPLSEADKVFRWYNGRVLEDTEKIGRVAVRHGMVITPKKGLALPANNE